MPDFAATSQLAEIVAVTGAAIEAVTIAAAGRPALTGDIFGSCSGSALCCFVEKAKRSRAIVVVAAADCSQLARPEETS